MGIMNTIFGNVSEMDIASLQKEFGALLCEGERIERAYKLIRDKWVFTNKRLIIQDVQGVTGKKREYLSVPYRSIERFSIETAGTFDMDAEMKIWIRGCEEPLEQNFGKDSNIIAYIIHSGFISGYQNRYGDNLKPPTNVYHRMTA